MPKTKPKSTPGKAPTMLKHFLADPSNPPEQRREILRNAPGEIIDEVLDQFCATKAGEVRDEKQQALDELVQDMQAGPLRPATYLGMIPPNGAASHLAEVRLDDGTPAFTAVLDPNLAKSLMVGDRVLLEKQARALLRRAPDAPRTGEEARLERCLDQGRVEISHRGDERVILRCAQALLDQIEAGEVGPGATLLVSHQQAMAYDVIPPADGLADFRYLEKVPPPDVVAERDMGAPPPIIEKVRDYFRLEMTNPDLRRDYRLPRSLMLLFTGVAGSGKTMSIQAIWRIMYEVMSDVTGVPIEDLPPRVFVLRLSELLNSLLGQSDKNVARFFSEVEQLAAEPFVLPDGREIVLPVLTVMEEIDGLATQRGRDYSGIHDRILTTVLQLLDPSRAALRDKLIVFIGTTNEAQHVDAAFIRRIGGTVVNFGRLKRRAFSAVLRTRLAGVRIAHGDEFDSRDERERALQSDLTAWLYSPNGSDCGVVELSFVGSSSPEIRYRRDFLNGALVDRAVKQACTEAADAEHRGEGGRPGLSLALLSRAFDHQIRSVADQLHEHNIQRFLDLPDAVRVASVRRLPQPDQTLHELQHH